MSGIGDNGDSGECVLSEVCCIGFRERFPKFVVKLRTLPARMEFRVCLPLVGKLVPPLEELEDGGF